MYLLKQQLHQTWSLELFCSLIEWLQTVAQSGRLRRVGLGVLVVGPAATRSVLLSISAHINRLGVSAIFM